MQFNPQFENSNIVGQLAYSLIAERELKFNRGCVFSFVIFHGHSRLCYEYHYKQMELHDLYTIQVSYSFPSPEFPIFDDRNELSSIPGK